MRGIAVDRVWTTREGDEIPIRRLDDSHLVNIIRFLRRTWEQERREALKAGYNILMFVQGEIASETIDNEIDFLESSDIDDVLDRDLPQWEYLMREIERRGLHDQI